MCYIELRLLEVTFQFTFLFMRMSKLTHSWLSRFVFIFRVQAIVPGMEKYKDLIGTPQHRSDISDEDTVCIGQLASSTR